MHMAAIDWLFKKLAGVAKQHASAKDKEVRARAAAKRSRLLLFFKPLGLLLGPVTPRDAARLRNHVESRIDEAKVEAARNTASYRAYDKRLLGIALKDKDAQVKVRTQGQGQEKKGKSAEMIEDSDVEDEPENEATPPADDAADDAEADEAEVAEDENAHTPTNGRSKRTHPDDDELPDLSLGDLGDIGDEIDLAFSPPQADRERSVSVAPDAKRRKTIRKF
jgi:cohesin complex subunit SA-1/2